MKEILQQLAYYNLWANETLTACILLLPEEQLNLEMKSSFKTIHETLLHIWDVESLWWQRLKLQETVIPPSSRFEGTTRDIAAALLHQNSLWKSWVDQASIAALSHVFLYQNTKRVQYKQPVFQALLHIFNHGTYHRGQIVTMLRELGVEKIPATDFIQWSRKTG